MFKLWLEGQSASTRTEIDALLAPLRSYIGAHGASEFLDLDGPNVATSIVISGWVDKDCYYFTPNAFSDICAPEDPKEVLAVLDRMNALKRNNKPAMLFKMPRSVPGRPSVYAVRLNSP